MATSVNKPVLAYTVIVLGVVLAAAAALEPFYDDGYRLRVGVLLSNLLPYLIYAIVVVLQWRPLTAVAGVALLVAHAWLVLSLHFTGAADYSDDMVYTVPMLLALALAPLWIMAMRQPWYGNDSVDSQQPAE